MRHLTMLLALGAMVTTWTVPAGAVTPGPECRTACAPRIAEQCGALVARELRRCRRPLLRACRATTPESACPSTRDLERAIGDRLLALAEGATLRLCSNRTFTLTEPPPTPSASPFPTPTVLVGAWEIEVERSGLVIDLADNIPLARRFPVQRDENGVFVVNGEPAVASDATAECNPPVAPPPPPVDPSDPERVLAVARAITDRAIVFGGPDTAGNVVQQRLTFCGSGALRVATLSQAVAEQDAGTWTIDDTGTTIELQLEQGIVPPAVGVAVLADGEVRLNDRPTDLSDARSTCDDLALEARFAPLLAGTVYVEPQSFGGLQFDVALAFCDADTFAIDNPIGASFVGSYSVDATNGTVFARLRAGGAVTRTATVTEAPDGTILLDGEPPVAGGEALVAAACS